MATQLRRYEVAEGGLDRLVEWFPKIIPVREKYGFTVNFAYADRDTGEFVWSVSHPGDFTAAEADYAGSPERTAAFEGFDNPITAMHISMIEEVV
ncbi:MAG: hypothetical protein OEV40_27870 [Acidimicrobiia bacterium]|nr:hypothetical protein [Acidimicrobiia bacterium]